MQALFDDLYVSVSDISDSHEWDLVEKRFYGVDGAEQEPTGRAPYRGTLQVGFVGDFWRTAYDALHALFAKGEAVSFTHPVTSEVYRVWIRQWRPSHSTNILNGAVATVTLVEDNLKVSGLVVTDAGVAGAAAEAEAACSTASSSVGALP